MKTRRIIIRILVVLALIALGTAMFFIGRGHTVYFDNKTLEYEGETYKAFYRVNLHYKDYYDGEKTSKLGARDRGAATCTGSSYTVTFEIIENKGDEPKLVEYTIKLPMDIDGIIFNIPGFMAGLPEEAYISEFVPVPSTETEAEETTDEMGGMDDMGLGDF